MSDSPYSLHNLGNSLNRSGAWVVGLRLPGHGTAPSGLVHARWQDMAATVKIAMRHLRGRVGRRAHLHGRIFQRRGALAVHYSLVVMDDDSLPRAETDWCSCLPPSAFRAWRCSRYGSRGSVTLLGLDKLCSGIHFCRSTTRTSMGHSPSMPGDQVYRLTAEDFNHFSMRIHEEALRRLLLSVLAFPVGRRRDRLDACAGERIVFRACRKMTTSWCCSISIAM